MRPFSMIVLPSSMSAAKSLRVSGAGVIRWKRFMTRVIRFWSCGHQRRLSGELVMWLNTARSSGGTRSLNCSGAHRALNLA